MTPHEVKTTRKKDTFYFKRLLERGSRNGTLSRLEEMQKRYRLNCPECGHSFWMERGLIKTSSFDGSLKGFQRKLL